MNADSIKIESDEDGFHLIIDGDSPCPEYQAAIVDYNITSCAEALHEQVNLIIGEWLAEGATGLVDYGNTPGTTDHGRNQSGGYDRSDPKHPEFHSIHADIHDQREKV